MRLGNAFTSTIFKKESLSARALVLLISLLSCANCDQGGLDNQSKNGIIPSGPGREITAQEAAAQFEPERATIDGLIMLDGPEIRKLVVGHTIRNRLDTPVTHREDFHFDGRSIVHLDNITQVEKYSIVGNALCSFESNSRWIFRRFYRDSKNRFYQLFSGKKNDLIPVQIVGLIST